MVCLGKSLPQHDKQALSGLSLHQSRCWGWHLSLYGKVVNVANKLTWSSDDKMPLSSLGSFCWMMRDEMRGSE